MKTVADVTEIRKLVAEIEKQFPLLSPVVGALHQSGGKVLLIGGAVRDLLLGLPVHEVDCEIYGLEQQLVHDILARFGVVRHVGISFGVFKIDGTAIDWSLPRSDSRGRKPVVSIDPNMSYADACVRRDLTINAMGIDLYTKEFIDPCHGYQDLQRRILRAPDLHRFIEDPLRLYRVMQFIGRFEASVDPSLSAVCRTMDIYDVSRERIELEFEKLLLKSKRPSVGIRWLQQIGRLQEILPDVYGTIQVPQRPDFHPEGDVFEHTMQAFDAAADIVRAYDSSQKLIILYAALCHDLGKQDVTVWKDDRWRSTGHAQAGVPRARALLKRITGKKKIVDTVALLVKYHMEPGIFVKGNARPVAYKKLACKVAPLTSMAVLADLSLADRRGRNANGPEPLTTDDQQVTEFRKNAQQAGVLYVPEEPVVRGQDLLDAGVTGIHIGVLLKRAYAIQLSDDIHDKEILKKRVLKDTIK